MLRKFQNHSKIIKSLICILIVILLLFLAFHALNHYYSRTDEWSYKLWHDFYAEDNNIDRLLLGSSHLYCGIEPTLLGELYGENCFNLSNSSQSIAASYFILREALKYNKPNTVYLELYHGASVNFESFDGPFLRNTDNMKPSLNKLISLVSLNARSTYIDCFLPFARYRQFIFDENHIVSQLEMKNSQEFKDYQFTIESGKGLCEYRGKGFFRSSYADVDLIYSPSDFEMDGPKLNASAISYLRKIIELCKKEGIDIKLFIAPVYQLQLMCVKDYDSYLSEIRGIADEYGVDFYDFNLLNSKLPSMQEEEYYFNIGHLNTKGAELFTSIFHTVFSGDASSNAKYFYDSFESKLADDEPQIWGLCKTADTYYIVASKCDGRLFDITRLSDGLVVESMKDVPFSSGFTLDLSGDGALLIESKSSPSLSLQIPY